MFTPQQQQVIDEDSAHLVVSAVAGSGKTATLIGRLVRLILSGADPARILVLMFGKSASDDFTARLARAAQRSGFTPPKVMTFHGFGMKIVGALERGKILPRMRLITQDYEVAKLARAALAEFNETRSGDEQLELTNELVQEFVEVVDFIKGSSTLDALSEYLATKDAESPLSSFKRDFLTTFLIFERMRHEARVRTFSDLIFDPVTAIRNEAVVAKFVSNRYDHVLVDEFQDINLAQWDLLKAVAGTRALVAAVGDEDQAIFSWRGASSDFMHALFERDFPGAKRFPLPHTFRYGHRLALAANHIISNNGERMDKMCLASPGNPDTLIDVLMSGVDGGQPAAAAIAKWVDEGRTLSEVAVLLREYSHSVSVEASLLRNNIPYRIIGAEPFFNRTEILSVRGNLQLAGGGLGDMDRSVMPKVISAMLRVPGLFLRTDVVERLVEDIAEEPNSFIQFMQHYEARASAAAGTGGAFKTKNIREAIDSWRYFANTKGTMSADTFLENMVRKLNLYNYFTRNDAKTESSNERVRMVQQLILMARNGKHTINSLVEYLNDLTERYAAIDSDADHVLMTSVHRSKGGQWPHVILPELADGKFPSVDEDSKEGDIADERRLFYVAITRAQEKLTLICPKDPQLQQWSNSFKLGHPPIQSIAASRFMFEGNFYGSVLADKKRHGKGATAISPDNPIISRYRAQIEGEQVAAT